MMDRRCKPEANHGGSRHVACIPFDMEPSDARLVFRLVIGTARLGIDSLLAVLRVPNVEREDGRTDERTHSMEHRLIGFVVEVGGDLARASRSLGTVYARTLRRWVKRGAATRPGRAAMRRARRAADAAATKLAHWEAVGLAEEAEGRRLAEEVIGAAIHTVFGEVSASPELQDLIAEQSAGLSRTAVRDLRERTAEADRRVESAVSRLWHPRRWRRRSVASPPAKGQE
jgi:hypothetical protein